MKFINDFIPPRTGDEKIDRIIDSISEQLRKIAELVNGKIEAENINLDLDDIPDGTTYTKVKIIWLDSSVRVLNLTANNPLNTWTDLDLTASTSANAKIAVLHITFRHSSASQIVCIRKNGTTPDATFRITNQVADQNIEGSGLVGMDLGQIVEWHCDVLNASRIVIDVLGYIE